MGFSDKFFDIKPFDVEEEKQNLIDNLDFLHDMTVEEQTLYKKWQEFNKNEYKIREKAHLFDVFEKRLWAPTDIYDKELTIKEINELQPIVEYAESEEASDWSLYRMLIHTMDWSANPGRNMKFYVKDAVTRKVLGIISMGSDVTSIKVRDDYIGWTKENKFEQHKLNNTAIASTIVSVQPLGYNMLGGKLIAALATVSTIRDKWQQEYGDVLAGVTTTSLYGIHSQYNGIPHWKTMGESAGKIRIKPDDSEYMKWNKWLKENYPDEFEKAITGTGPKQNVLNKVFSHLKIRGYEHGFHRGVYFASIYDNTIPFLKNEIEESELKMKLKYEEDYEYINRWWKKKAIRRYESMISQNRIKPEKLFYGDIVGISWDKCKEMYLKEVGR